MKIAVVTTTRAEYGILRPLIKKLNVDKDIELQLLVTGTHLSEKYGNTQTEIEQDGIPIFEIFPIMTDGQTALDISLIMANAIQQFARYFDKEKPTCVVVLGDRTELLGICSAAMNEEVPIIHLHGGELTEGAVDDRVRHAISKMAYLHFPSTEIYKKRLIQMGESPDRVYNVGALGIENIVSVPLLSEKEIREYAGVPSKVRYVVVTFHAVTLEKGSERGQTRQLIAAMQEKKDYFYLLTKGNADVGSDIVDRMLKEYADTATNTRYVASLGMSRYLSAVKYAALVLGNSSSGIIEAPSLGTPTVNIGDRQRGRLMAESIVNCKPEKDDIVNAIKVAEKMEHIPSFIYGDGNTSKKIVEILKTVFADKSLSIEKKFYDIEFSYG